MVAKLEQRARGIGDEPVPKIEALNMVVRFEGEGGVRKVDPLKLTKTMRTSKVCQDFRRWKSACWVQHRATGRESKENE